MNLTKSDFKTARTCATKLLAIIITRQALLKEVWLPQRLLLRISRASFPGKTLENLVGSAALHLDCRAMRHRKREALFPGGGGHAEALRETGRHLCFQGQLRQS